MKRSTTEVIDDHLRRREAGDLAGDLATNYAADVVLLCEHGPMAGRAGVERGRPVIDVVAVRLWRT